MPKKEVKKTKKVTKKKTKKKKHPVFKREFTLGEKAADKMADFCGSWTFIILVLAFIGIWILLNTAGFILNWDPWPFIMLNLALSCLAALQAPVILMSQKRAAERDRIQAQYDYKVNRKAEREITKVHKELETIKGYLYKNLREINPNNKKK
jgi:uncharacterized membrane protein